MVGRIELAGLASPLKLPSVANQLTVRALSEIGVDTPAVFTDEIDRVVDRLHVIHHVRVDTPPQEGREHGHADEAAPIGDEAQLLGTLVAGVLLESSGQAAGVAHRPGGHQDHFG